MSLPGLAHHTVHLENKSAKPWRLEAVDLGTGAKAATGLVISLLDQATGQYHPCKPDSDGRFVLPAKARLALETESSLAGEDEPQGARYHFRLLDEAGHWDPCCVLYYSISWYFACKTQAPCHFGRSVRFAPYGDLMRKVVTEASPLECHITADAWPVMPK